MEKYRSCHSVEGELFFNHLNKVGYCCMTTHCGGQPVLYANYNGELIDWDEFLSNREEHIQLMKNGGCLDACKNCTWIVEREWPKRKKALNYILINVWVKCNLFCVYCKNHDNGKPSEVELNTQEYDILPVLVDMHSKGMIDENTRFDIAGGEACLDKNFNNLLDFLITIGVKNININSNCTIFSQSIVNGVEKGIISVTTSIDSGTPKMFNYIKKANLWEKVWKNIEKYSLSIKKENKNFINTKYIILPDINDKKSQIFNFVLKSKLAGVSKVLLNIDMHWLSANEFDEKKLLKVITLSKYFIKVCNQLKMDYKIWSHIEDLIKRYNNNFPKNTVDIDFIYNSPTYNENFFDKIYLKFLKISKFL